MRVSEERGHAGREAPRRRAQTAGKRVIRPLHTLLLDVVRSAHTARRATVRRVWCPNRSMWCGQPTLLVAIRVRSLVDFGTQFDFGGPDGREEPRRRTQAAWCHSC